MRTLRSYQRMAYKHHDCDRCCCQILPGDMYEGRVEVNDRNQIMVWKQHIMPSCDFPPEPKDYENIESNRSFRLNFKESPLDKAA